MAPNKDLVRYSEVRRADSLDDQKVASQILGSLGVSVTQENLQEFVLSQLKRVIFGDTPGHWYDDFNGIDGIPSLYQLGTSGAESVAKVRFTYATPSPMVLQALPAGSVLDRASILITTPFNDATATLQLGTSATPGLVFASGETTATRAGQYDNAMLTEFSVGDLFRLLINPAASTEGAGLLLYKLRS